MLVVHHDFTSPAAVVAVLRLQRIADAGGAVTFSGIDVLGTTIPVPPTLDLLAELDRWAPAARRLGVAMGRPTRQPPTLSCHLVAELAAQVGVDRSWRMRVLTAYWQEDRDISDDGVLEDLARDVGLDAAAVTERLRDAVGRRAMAARMATRRRNGIGGVPVLEFEGTLVSASLPDDALHQLATL